MQLLAVVPVHEEHPVKQAKIITIKIPVHTLLDAKNAVLQEAWQVVACRAGVALAQQYVLASTYPDEHAVHALLASWVHEEHPVVQAEINNFKLLFVKQMLFETVYPLSQAAWQAVPCRLGVAAAQQYVETKE